MSRSKIARQSLQLRIDPTPHPSQAIATTSSISSSSSSARTNLTASSTTPSSGVSTQSSLSVLCFYDFHSTDKDQLPFHKNEVLEIVKQEDTGWWAAMRQGGNTIGWIPEAFVKTLTEDMADRLRSMREEVRIYEYNAEQLYNSAPTSLIQPDEEQSTEPSAKVNKSILRARVA